MSEKTILIIVESPAKCKKIESFLSKRKGTNWIVKASYGHIRELKSSLSSSIDIQNDFKPSYQISESKIKVVNELKKIANKQNTETIIATDPDREGEAIGYHLLKTLNLDVKTTKRIYFNQITEKAVLNSLDNPTLINMNLVNAQQARSIVDKLVGYEVSPILWKHVKTGLSAGRCQSPALRILCEKEKQIKEFDKKSFFKLFGVFKNEKQEFIIDFICEKHFNDKQTIYKLINKFKNDEFTIKEIKKNISKNNPSSPFTTSSLQQEASSKLNISPKECMSLAQKLYEGGYITYMRTDSIELADEAKDNIKKFIYDNYGKDFYYDEKQNGKRDKHKSKNSQEAHEAIRPVNIEKMNVPESFNSKGQKLYQLIWKKTISSQMTAQQLEIYKINLESKNTDEIFSTSIDKTIFEGHNIVYKTNNSNNQNTTQILKNIQKGQKMFYEKIIGEQKFTKPIPRFTEASLIKELEKIGIGRPSTFSGIITKIQEKSYVEKKTIEGLEIKIEYIELKNEKITEKNNKIIYGGEKDKLFVSDIGHIVNDFLTKHFSNTEQKGFIDFSMTSNMEKQLDEIAQGKQDWVKIIKKIYHSFHPKVIELSKSKIKEKDTYQQILGKDEDGLEIGITMGKDSLVLYKKGKDYKSKWNFAPIENIENITLEKAITALSFPKKIGKINEKEVIIKNGKFGYYIHYDSKNISLNGYDHLKINIDQVKEILKGNIRLNEKDIIGKYNDVNIIFKTGKFGNYLSYDENNFTIKNTKKEDITLKEAITIINQKNKTILKEFDKELSIRTGKTGPYIMLKKGKEKPVFISFPKNKEIDKITQEECLEIINK